MIFNIHHDSGNLIHGTVIPDAYSHICRIRVSARGEEIAIFPTNVLNQGVLDLGLHETGLVDFTITEEALPGLSTLADLELHEVETNLLLYRRFRPEMVRQKFLRLETQLLPLWRLDEAVKDRFQQYYKRIEILGLNATRQIFHLSQDSIYASGRVLISNFTHCTDNGFRLLVLVRDPYEEFAERLLLLSKISEEGLQVLGEREAMTLREAAKYAASLPIEDEKALIRGLRQMPKDVSMTLANPVVRQFSTTAPDEQPRQSGVAVALNVLAESAI